MRRVLPAAFFDRPTLVVARELLGKYLVRRVGGREVAVMITETEAYDGLEDLASHSSKGRTPRTEVMFGKAGVWYVYFVYGMHEMLNVVTKKDGAAVLIRAGFQPAEAPKGALRAARPSLTPFETSAGLHINGPAKLTKFLKVDRSLNRMPAAKASGLWVEDRGVVVKPSQIQKGPRVGVDYAGLWAHKPYRFVYTNKKSENRSPRP